MRSTFDRISLSLIAFLERQHGVCNVDYVDRPGATEADLRRWHVANDPFRLPADLLNFYSLQNGFVLRWKMRYMGDVLPLGSLNINAVNRVERRDIRNAVFLDIDRRPVQVAAAFDIDELCLDGRVVLAVTSESATCGVYFQDLSCQFFFVSDSFTSYLRLLFLHIGLPRWQYAFTNSGLPQSSIQWFRLLIPRRLQLDLHLSPEFEAPRNADKAPSRQFVLDIDKIEKNAKDDTSSDELTRLIRARDASKKKHKKSTSDLPSAASSDSLQQRVPRPGSAPGRRPGPGLLSATAFQPRNLTRPETGVRRQIRGSFG